VPLVNYSQRRRCVLLRVLAPVVRLLTEQRGGGGDTQVPDLGKRMQELLHASAFTLCTSEVVEVSHAEGGKVGSLGDAKSSLGDAKLAG
jgi:hypothetical protein